MLLWIAPKIIKSFGPTCSPVSLTQTWLVTPSTSHNLTIVESTTNHELMEARCFSSWRNVDRVDMKRLNQGPDWDIGPLVHLHIALCVFKGTSPASDMPRYFSIWPEVPSQAVLFSDLRLFLRGVSRLWIQGMGQELQHYGTLWNQLVGGWRSTTTSSLLLGHHGLDPYTDWWLILTRRLEFFFKDDVLLKLLKLLPQNWSHVQNQAWDPHLWMFTIILRRSLKASSQSPMDSRCCIRIYGATYLRESVDNDNGLWWWNAKIHNRWW